MTTVHEIPCYPVPHYPGYCINRRGQVFGPRGMLKIVIHSVITEGIKVG